MEMAPSANRFALARSPEGMLFSSWGGPAMKKPPEGGFFTLLQRTRSNGGSRHRRSGLT